MQALPKLAGSNAQVAILGTGKAKYEAMVKTMGAKNPKFKGVVKFSAPLAHTITAGADFILVPSRWVQETSSQLAAVRSPMPARCTGLHAPCLYPASICRLPCCQASRPVQQLWLR